MISSRSAEYRNFSDLAMLRDRGRGSLFLLSPRHQVSVNINLFSVLTMLKYSDECKQMIVDSGLGEATQ